MDLLLQQWRDDTPGCTNQIHLNNAGAGLMPLPVLDAIVGHLNREAKFGGYESADDAEATVSEAYNNVSKLLDGYRRLPGLCRLSPALPCLTARLTRRPPGGVPPGPGLPIGVVPAAL